jgi:predicted RNase H-like HicB family nuclease
MIYPILIHQTEQNTIVALCPVIPDFYVESKTVDEALQSLQNKFKCYVHDSNIQFEIISLDSGKKDSGIYA